MQISTQKTKIITKSIANTKCVSLDILRFARMAKWVFTADIPVGILACKSAHCAHCKRPCGLNSHASTSTTRAFTCDPSSCTPPRQALHKPVDVTLSRIAVMKINVVFTPSTFLPNFLLSSNYFFAVKIQCLTCGARNISPKKQLIL